MTIVQLEYAVALDTYRHFATAAEKCFVTQPTLSMQIQKLEENLGVTIFDRNKQPIEPTVMGASVIAQARVILSEYQRLKEMIADKIGELSGDLRVGIIPTIAPYLLPLFLGKYVTNFPEIRLVVKEMTTSEIIQQLKYDLLDVAILATPLQEPLLMESPIYYEPFVLYLSDNHPLLEYKEIDLEEIELKNIWLLNEGHCLRGQITDLCSRFIHNNGSQSIIFESGSIETLTKLININHGVTFLPQLATLNMPEEELEKVRFFKSPSPVREISLVSHRHSLKKKAIDALKKEILANIPNDMKLSQNKKVIPVTGIKK